MRTMEKLKGSLSNALYYDFELVAFFGTEQTAWLHVLRDDKKVANQIHIAAILISPTGTLVDMPAVQCVERDLYNYRVVTPDSIDIKMLEGFIKKDLAKAVEEGVL